MNAPAILAPWTPCEGETVHLRADNPWTLPAGRYRLEGDRAGNWRLSHLNTGEGRTTTGYRLTRLEAQLVLTPITAADLERDRLELALRLAAPLKQPRYSPMRWQDDASALPMFRAANEPGLGL